MRNRESGSGGPDGPVDTRAEGELIKLADSVSEMARTMRSSRARLVSQARTDPESAAQLLLRVIARNGPMRASAMAESVHVDLSTVSRQVSALVERGILERRADPADGRACLLALTDVGQERLVAHEQTRAGFFAEVFDGWRTEDLSAFATLLDRFTAAYERTHADWSATAHASSVSATHHSEGINA